MKAPNRVVAVVAAVMSLSLAVLPVVGNFDWTSTAGALAGVVAVLAVAHTWLVGWQKHEARLYEYEPNVVEVDAAKATQAARAWVKKRGSADPFEFSVPNVTTASTATYFTDVTDPTYPPEEQPPLLPGEDVAELAAWREHASHESPPLTDPTLPGAP